MNPALHYLRAAIAHIKAADAHADAFAHLNTLRDRLGSDAAAAKAIGVTRQVVCQWRRAGRVPRRWWAKIASVVNNQTAETA